MFGVIVLTALVAVASAGIIPDGKIVGGSATTIQDHPYQVSILKYGAHICGGTLYKEDVVVTAAHCLQGKINVYDLSVRVGSTNKYEGGQVVRSKAYKNHPSYSKDTNSNDVAVIRLIRNVTLSAAVRTVELSTFTPTTGTSAIVSGWGRENPDVAIGSSNLREAEVKVIDSAECMSPRYNYYKSTLTVYDAMFCAMADSTDACQGDSGGPLVSGNKLVGVISWGYGCARPGYPGVYTDVSQYREWIDETGSSL